ncbi:NHL repeat containing protein [Neobacillus bataviensis LMG 21833]|uniref:NHL repeat containing protein n=1 Tax=Neobacillus bataviensis LMG 21833 TaxID=1117379 RepID=K6ED37_9BACI|nr:6-bladed beta-propeller [Neobacillus bataviensis]EKN71371.1 NHL repeat containing protein [Neobacillus bataviensis LMG 21833]
MKKTTVYIWMSAMVVLSTALFSAITFLDLGSTLKPIVAAANPVGGEPEFRQSFYGSFESPLNKPMDVSKIGEFIYVTDTKNNQVQVFNQAGNNVLKFGKAGSEKGQFQFPYGITGDKDENIYVADLYNANISIFNSKGEFIKYFPDPEKAIKAPGGMRIYDEKLYVTDIKENKLFVFNLAGKKLMEIGGPGQDEGRFIAPNAVAVDKDKQIYVTDSGNNRVQVFDKEGKFIKVINGSKDGKGNSIFVNPRGVAIDSKGTVYVVSNLSHNIYAYDKEGNEARVLGGMGTDNGQLYLPNGLFIDDRDAIYVTDTINQRISVFY